MSDIEKAFTYLHDNIPQWLDDISKVELKIAAMQSELAKVPMAESRMLKHKTGSMESIRELELVDPSPGTSVVPTSPPPATRKRKTHSILSGRASGPSKFRSRSMIVVYYDGQIQTSFEQLVRVIGTGRNMLRKGKMAARLEAMTALAASEDGDEENVSVMAKIGYRHRAGLSSMRPRAARLQSTSPTTAAADDADNDDDNSTTPTDLFDSTDKALEHAQSLCEKAAHASLREGDCRKELDTARGHLDQVFKLTKKEAARYALRKQKEGHQATKEASKPDGSTPAPMVQHKPSMVADTAPTTTPNQIRSLVMDIEVDDDEEDDDMNFTMPPIRLTSRA